MKLTSETSIEALNRKIREEDLKQTGILGADSEVTIYLSNGESYTIESHLMPLLDIPEGKYNKILYGKNSLEKIVGAECDGDYMHLFIQNGKSVETKLIKNRLWVLANKDYQGKFNRLNGDRYYKYARYYTDVEKWEETNKIKNQYDLYKSYCPVESNFIARGFTFFKGMQIKDISVLSFDIESSGIVKDQTSDVYLISNTFRVGDYTETKLFDFHDYSTRKAMLEAWCAWVREKDPSLIIGHNIYMYDFPYLQHVAMLNDTNLELGRDKSSLKISNWPSKFRKDGNEKIEYFKSRIWGREIIDTFFLSFKYDVSRKYESNGLKQIIKQEGLEKQGRTFVDASKIRNYIYDKEMWLKIRQYAIEDSDDSLKLFDIMAPSFFYFSQMVPKKFEDIINGASGSQLNTMLIRAYLQDNKAIPKGEPKKKFQGAISHSIPGIYRNVWKVDVASEYPSVIRHFKLYNEKKDPEGYFLYITEELTKERLKNKELGKTSKYYYDLEQSGKIGINSLYGLCGAPGLNFNDMNMAEFITAKGRDIIDTATIWATGKNNLEWGWTPKEAEDENGEEI